MLYTLNIHFLRHELVDLMGGCAYLSEGSAYLIYFLISLFSNISCFYFKYIFSEVGYYWDFLFIQYERLSFDCPTLLQLVQIHVDRLDELCFYPFHCFFPHIFCFMKALCALRLVPGQ